MFKIQKGVFGLRDKAVQSFSRDFNNNLECSVGNLEIRKTSIHVFENSTSAIFTVHCKSLVLKFHLNVPYIEPYVH